MKALSALDSRFETTLAKYSSGTVLPRESANAAGLIVSSPDELPLTVIIGNESFTVDAPVIPGWASILPSLGDRTGADLPRGRNRTFAGVWLGTFFVVGFNPLTATGRLVDLFLVPAVANTDHAAIMVFTLFLGAMVGIVSRNGGTQGIVKAVEPLASNPKRGKIATWLAGLAIFFDDYANTLIVGNTMRPITDRLKISREKLAYLVDSTAAPVAALVPVSTWVGYEISLIGDGLLDSCLPDTSPLASFSKPVRSAFSFKPYPTSFTPPRFSIRVHDIDKWARLWTHGASRGQGERW